MENLELIEEIENKETAIAVEENKVTNYIEFLKLRSNPLVEYGEEFFLKDAYKRIKKLSTPKIGLEALINSYIEYLRALAFEESKTDFKYFNVATHQGTRLSNLSPSCLQIGYLSRYSDAMLDPNYVRSIKDPYTPLNWYASYRVTILPYCCGVCEFGGFSFYNQSQENSYSNLRFNLIADIIRLHSLRYPKTPIGAVNIINYFVRTPFTRVLESRDDMTFIKEFTNPKTKLTLKMFMFDSKI